MSYSYQGSTAVPDDVKCFIVLNCHTRGCFPWCIEEVEFEFIDFNYGARTIPHAGNNLPHTCYIKSKSYTHNPLKRFIALQNLMPVVQRLHPFTMLGRMRNGWITIGHTGFLWGIGPMVNMS
jgi:hypothetical protein